MDSTLEDEIAKRDAELAKFYEDEGKKRSVRGRPFVNRAQSALVKMSRRAVAGSDKGNRTQKQGTSNNYSSKLLNSSMAAEAASVVEALSGAPCFCLTGVGLKPTQSEPPSLKDTRNRTRSPSKPPGSKLRRQLRRLSAIRGTMRTGSRSKLKVAKGLRAGRSATTAARPMQLVRAIVSRSRLLVFGGGNNKPKPIATEKPQRDCSSVAEYDMSPVTTPKRKLRRVAKLRVPRFSRWRNSKPRFVAFNASKSTRDDDGDDSDDATSSLPARTEVFDESRCQLIDDDEFDPETIRNTCGKSAFKPRNPMC